MSFVEYHKPCPLCGSSDAASVNEDGSAYCFSCYERIPDYYIHETDQWLVFPHELQGLSMDEIRANKPELDSLIKNIESLKSK